MAAAAAAAAAAAGWCPGIMGYLPAECGMGILMGTGLIPGEGIPMGVPAEDIILRYAGWRCCGIIPRCMADLGGIAIPGMGELNGVRPGCPPCMPDGDKRPLGTCGPGRGPCDPWNDLGT